MIRALWGPTARATIGVAAVAFLTILRVTAGSLDQGWQMHELSLMEGVLEIVQDAQARHGFQKVTRIVLEVGTLAGVEREALDFCWDVVAKDTPAEGAVLELVEVAAMAWCGRCAGEVPVASRIDFCPGCGGIPERIVRGLDLQVKTLDVEG